MEEWKERILLGIHKWLETDEHDKECGPGGGWCAAWGEGALCCIEREEFQDMLFGLIEKEIKRAK